MLAGLALCLRSLQHAGFEQRATGFLTLGVVAALATTGLCALVASAVSWRHYLFALSGYRLTFNDAFYQVGLVLMGKYVPIVLGGVMARVTANAARASAASVVGATLLEQCGAMIAATWVGVACISFVYAPVGGITLLALALAAAWVAPVVAAPLLATIVWLRSRFGRQAIAHVVLPDRRALRVAWLAQVAQWLALSVFVAAAVHIVMPSATSADLLTLAGAYGIAVVVGIAAFMFPGGLGPREATFVWLGGRVVGYDTAVAMASALRVAMTSIDLLAGAGCLVHWMRDVVRKRSIQTP